MNDHRPQPQPAPALAAWIRAVRRHAGLSQVELAERLSLAQSSVSQWEKGITQPSTPHMLRLLQMFPASVGELIADRTTTDAAAPKQSA
jgi:transcriptional regulator with XRE-family HTH domain